MKTFQRLDDDCVVAAARLEVVLAKDSLNISGIVPLWISSQGGSIDIPGNYMPGIIYK